MTVYSNNGNRVELNNSTLTVYAANGQVMDRYPIGQVEKAVEAADELARLAESEAVTLIAA